MTTVGEAFKVLVTHPFFIAGVVMVFMSIVFSIVLPIFSPVLALLAPIIAVIFSAIGSAFITMSAILTLKRTGALSIDRKEKKYWEIK